MPEDVFPIGYGPSLNELMKIFHFHLVAIGYSGNDHFGAVFVFVLIFVFGLEPVLAIRQLEKRVAAPTGECSINSAFNFRVQDDSFVARHYLIRIASPPFTMDH